MGKQSPFGVDWTPGLELYVDGAWEDVTADLSSEGVQIERGRDSERTRTEPSSLGARLKNATGRYSPRNPNSDLYGLIGRNTPVRTYVDLGAPWLHLEGTNANASCPDSAGLSITGDLDVRWWGRRNQWGTKTDLISKYGASGQRSWILQADLDAGTVTFYWSTDGTALLSATSTVPLPAWTRTIAIRATLDVDNGASGRTVTFYWSTNLTAGWTQLGDAVTAAGTTSVFDSTATVVVGKNTNTDAGNPTVRVYGWEILQGIAGTVRASVDMADVAAGATSFSDGTNTWTVNSPATVGNRHYRFYGEVTEWPQRWGRTGSLSSSTPLVGAGLTRRLVQGAKPLRSPLRRALPSVVNLRAYWPMEDQAGSTSFWGAGGGAGQATRTSAVTTGNYDGFPGATVAPTLGEGRITCNVPTYTVTTELAVRLMAMVENGAPDGAVLATVAMASGGIRSVNVVYSTTGGGTLGLDPIDEDGNIITAGPVVVGGIDNTPGYLSIELTQSGSDVTLGSGWYTAGASGASVNSVVVSSSDFGMVKSVRFNPGFADFGGSAVGHVTVQNDVTDLFTVGAAPINGHAGEEADARVERLATENGITVRVQGPEADTAPMGVQRSVIGLLGLLQECADSDHGFLYEARDSDDLAYRRLAGMLAQPAALTIPYTDNLLVPFEPTDDDQDVRNDVEVVRDGGSSATYTVTSGPLSTQAPPNGVGTYDESVTLSLYDDDQCADHASWLAHVGTHDEARWPTIGLDLAHPTFLADPVLTRDILSLELGDRLDVTDLPAWLPPYTVSVLVQKAFESIEPLSYRLEFTCTPARPYAVPVWGTSGLWGNDTTETDASVTTSATSFTVDVGADGDWSTADGSLSMLMGGELITVGSVSGSGTQTFSSVTRSVNGVVKSHDAGTKVALAEPSFWGL